MPKTGPLTSTSPNSWRARSTSANFDFSQLFFEFGQFDFGHLAEVELPEVELAEVEHPPPGTRHVILTNMGVISDKNEPDLVEDQ